MLKICHFFVYPKQQYPRICHKFGACMQSFVIFRVMSASHIKCPYCGRDNFESSRGLTQHQNRNKPCQLAMLEAFGLSQKKRRIAHDFMKTMPTNVAASKPYVCSGPNHAFWTSSANCAVGTTKSPQSLLFAHITLPHPLQLCNGHSPIPAWLLHTACNPMHPKTNTTHHTPFEFPFLLPQEQ